MCMQVLGPSHAYTLGVASNLGELLMKISDWAPAREILERTLAGQEALLGMTHPQTAGTALSLGQVLQELSERASSRDCFGKASDAFEKLYGPDHILSVHSRELLEAVDMAMKTEETIGELPELLTHAGHEHALTKTARAYDGVYGCDVCRKSGFGWVYQCVDCGYDVHPLCISASVSVPPAVAEATSTDTSNDP